MKLLYIVPVCGLIAVVLANKCRVTDGPDAVLCGVHTNMTCGTDTRYTPYCHKAYNSRDGICTCEKFCFDVAECQGGCHSSRFRTVCTNLYTGSLEKICLCQWISG